MDDMQVNYIKLKATDRASWYLAGIALAWKIGEWVWERIFRQFMKLIDYISS